MPLYHILLLMLMSACTPLITYHGNDAPDKKISALRTQVSNRENVSQVLGSPSATSLDGKSLWLYMSRQTESWIPVAKNERARRVVAISFDKKNLIKEKRVLTIAQNRNIHFVTEKTPSPIPKLNWIQRLFGNIGRVSPSGIPTGSTP